MQQTRLLRSHSWQKDSLFLLLILGGLFFLLLGIKPLFVPDEGRYAEIAREMVESGNYITPHLNGIKYFEKPPLFYWLGALAIKIGGLNLWALRSVNAILGLLGCFFTYFTARKLYDRETAFLSALILGTSTLYFAMVNMINLDLTVTFFLMSTLYCFLLSIHHPEGRTRKFYIWSASSFAALAVLTKGLIGIVFPVLIIGTWLIFLNEWRLLKKIYLPSSLLIFFLIVTPWHILVGIKNPEFFYFYFITQHFLRYATLSAGHYESVWYFIPCLIFGFFPWILFLPAALKFNFPKSWHERYFYRKEIFLILWSLIIFTFFSFSKSKLIPYILPIFPPIALLTARYLAQNLTPKVSMGIKLSNIVFIVLSVFIAFVFCKFGFSTQLPHPLQAKIYLILASILIVMTSVLSSLFALKNNRHFITIIIVGIWLFLIAGLASVPAIDDRTILPLAKHLKSRLKPTDEVVTFGKYFQDLPFYLERRVMVVNWINEFEFGMQHQNTKDWMLRELTFWQHWVGPRQVYVLMDPVEYKRLHAFLPVFPFFPVGQFSNTILLSNHPI